MTLVVSKFRTEFPEFADTTVYTDQMITFWAGFAEVQVRQCVWNSQWQSGVKLYVAHEITIEAQSKKAASLGGVPGTSGGIANTKTVGSVTVGYDAATTTEKDAGWWNRTIYGQQYIRLARIFGARALQV